MILRAAVLAIVPLVVVAACSSPPTPTPCSDVPAGGCPQDNGADVCQDPSCDAVYDCVNGKWAFDRACPAHPRDASADAPDGATDASTQPRDVHIDAPAGAFGGPGCTDLQQPDCSVGTALLCMDATGCCGCQDLWVCQNGGWVSWGVCADAGVVQN